MRRSCSILTVVGLVLVVAVSLAATLRPGQQSQAVFVLQENLARLGFFHGSPTGYYGQQTTAAVKDFQRHTGLVPDGIAGEQTLAAVQRALSLRSEQMTSRGSGGTVVLLSWETMNQLWRRGTTARVYDVATGTAFVAWRLGGSLHADVEPQTKYDTYLLRRVYGGRWSWARRAIIVELNGRYIAASMNGMPHGKQGIYNNDFPGQFCIHFLGSRLHKNRQLDADHQAMVQEAARSGLGDLIRPAAESPLTEPLKAQQEQTGTLAGPLEVE